MGKNMESTYAQHVESKVLVIADRVDLAGKADQFTSIDAGDEGFEVGKDVVPAANRLLAPWSRFVVHVDQ